MTYNMELSLDDSKIIAIRHLSELYSKNKESLALGVQLNIEGFLKYYYDQYKNLTVTSYSSF